ncbi:MAG: hypothetical protein Unbinned3620contig1001_19 [Prokaryotic dsDNA virus sp.]|nr:MAG: hypothetical protein Unbinned3620contig1001_19 [Prokaryotic dsDNA virus sp.]
MQSVLIILASLALLMGALCLFLVSYYVYLLIKKVKIEEDILLARQGDLSNVPVFDVVYGDNHG